MTMKHFTLLIRHQRLTGNIETYFGRVASWNLGRWKSPSKPSNALSAGERRQKLAAKHHGIYEIPGLPEWNFTCVRVSLALLSLRKNGGLLVIYEIPPFGFFVASRKLLYNSENKAYQWKRIKPGINVEFDMCEPNATDILLFAMHGVRFVTSEVWKLTLTSLPPKNKIIMSSLLSVSVYYGHRTSPEPKYI